MYIADVQQPTKRCNVLNINIPSHIDAAIAEHDPNNIMYEGYTRDEMKEAAAHLSRFLKNYRRVLSLSKISKEAKMPIHWAYNVEKAAHAGAIRPDRAQLFVDIASKMIMQRFGKG